MKTTVKKLSDTKVEIKVVLDKKDLAAAREKAITRLATEVKIPGFRKGKVPRSVFEKKFGKESLYFDAANAVLEEAYTKVMTDSKLIPVVQPWEKCVNFKNC